MICSSEDTILTRIVMICGWERFSLKREAEEFNPDDHLNSLPNLQNRQEKIILFGEIFSELAEIQYEW